MKPKKKILKGVSFTDPVKIKPVPPPIRKVKESEEHKGGK